MGALISSIFCTAHPPSCPRGLSSREIHPARRKTDIVWTAVGSQYHQGFHKVIVSMHHAGYDESLAIPNTPSPLRRLSFLLSVSSRHLTARGHIQKSGTRAPSRYTHIVPIGYPKLDLAHQYIESKQTATSIIICFTRSTTSPLTRYT